MEEKRTLIKAETDEKIKTATKDVSWSIAKLLIIQTKCSKHGIGTWKWQDSTKNGWWRQGIATTTDLTVLENNHTLSFFATGCTPQRSSSNDNFHQIRLHKNQVYNLFQPLSFLFDHLKLPRRGGIAVPRRGVFKGTGRKCCFNCKRLLVVTFDKEEYDWPSGYLQTIHT